MMSKLAIIPARGGSKRIPRKNIKLFHGKPIISYSIEKAILSEIFDEVMVSTDDEEIRQIALSLGAKVPFLRSKVNSSSEATTLDVIEEVKEEYKKSGMTFDYICCIYPTAPFIKIEELKKGFELLISQNASTCFPVVPYTHPIHRSLQIDGSQIKKNFPDVFDSRTQDFEKTFHDAGQWYWIDNHAEITSLINENSTIIELSNLEAQDLDNFVDWELAELKFKLFSDGK